MKTQARVAGQSAGRLRSGRTVDGALALTAGLRRPVQIAVSLDGELERLEVVRW